MKILRSIMSVYLILVMLSAPVFMTGCGSLKPVPVAEGNDPVVVYAERAQRSSLAIYKEITEWELANRAALPAEVSRAVDAVRREFKPAWEESRRALALYKQQVPGVDATTLDRITGALLVFQATLLRLKQDSNPNEVAQVGNALSSLIASIRSLFGSTTTPALQPQR